MQENSTRLSAVIAALERVREHVDSHASDTILEPSAYNRWIGMLDDAIHIDAAGLLLEPSTLPADEYLMHLDATLAFLKEHLEEMD